MNMFKSIRQLIASVSAASQKCVSSTSTLGASAKQKRTNRGLTLETLESRELLSVNIVSVSAFENTFQQYEGASITTKYADLKLNQILNEYNRIDVVWDKNTSAATRTRELYEAIDMAYQSKQEDIIIVRMADKSAATVNLTNGELDIDFKTGLEKGAMYIVGLGGGLTIDAQNNSRNFVVRANNTLGLANVTVTGGNGLGYDYAYGGAIYNNGNLVITHSTITGNNAMQWTQSGSLGNDGCNMQKAESRGGGIYSTSNGDVFISYSDITNNTAQATSTGDGGRGYRIAEAIGGGIYSAGRLEIRNSVNISGNTVTATNTGSGAELIIHAYGGGIYQKNAADFFIAADTGKANTIADNTVTAMNTGAANNSTHTNNHAGTITYSAAILLEAYGGGVFLADDETSALNAAVHIENTKIDRNKVTATNSGNATTNTLPGTTSHAIIGVDAYGGGIYTQARTYTPLFGNAGTIQKRTLDISKNSSVSGNVVEAKNTGNARDAQTGDGYMPGQVIVYTTALGGGVFNNVGTDLTVQASVIDNNTVDSNNSGTAVIAKNAHNTHATVVESAGAGIYNGGGYVYPGLSYYSYYSFGIPGDSLTNEGVYRQFVQATDTAASNIKLTVKDSSSISGNSANSINTGNQDCATNHGHMGYCTNARSLGAGLFNGTDGTTTKIENSVMSENIAASYSYAMFTTNESYALGGAIYNAHNTIEVTNVTFDKNKAEGLNGSGAHGQFGYVDHLRQGGAIYNGPAYTTAYKADEETAYTGNYVDVWAGAASPLDGSEGTLILKDSRLTGNEAKLGGAIWNSGMATIDNSDFTGNKAIYYTQTNREPDNGFGGAIFNTNLAADGNNSYPLLLSNVSLTVTRTNFAKNTADLRGGAVFNAMPDDTSEIGASFTDCRFTANTAQFGGAVANQNPYDPIDPRFGSPARTTILSSIFTDNNKGFSQAMEGGALFNGPSGILQLGDSLLVGNTSGHGGGVYNVGTFTAVHTTIVDNTAGSNGGGVYNESQVGRATESYFYNCIVVDNKSEGIGDVVNDSAASAARQMPIVAGEGLLSILALDSGVPSPTAIWSGTADTYFEYSKGLKLFNDSKIRDYTLDKNDTQARNQGTPVTAFSLPWYTVSDKDLNGTLRPQGYPDLGAYEFPEVPNAPQWAATAYTSKEVVPVAVITLHWTFSENLSGGTKYILQVKTPGQNTFETVTPYDGVDDFADFTLGIEGTYEFRVQAIAADNSVSSSYSGILKVDCVKPKTPTNFNARDVKVTTATLTWTKPVTATHNYTLERYVFDSVNYNYATQRENPNAWTLQDTKTDIPASAIQEDVTGLLPNTHYRFKLYATNMFGQSEPAVRDILTVPNKPENFESVGKPTYNSAVFKWTAQFDLTGYTLQYRVKGTSTWSSEVYPPIGSAGNFTINGLQPDTEYEFRIAARNETGISEWAYLFGDITNTVKTPAAPPATPTGFEVVTEQTTDTTITLQWDSQEDAEGYRLRYKEEGATDWLYDIPDLGKDDLSYKVTGLTPNKRYEFDLTARNDSEAKYSEVGAKVTGQTAPSVPTGLTLVPDDPARPNPNYDRIAVQWDTVTGLKYVLEYRQTEQIDAGVENAWTSINIPEGSGSWTVYGLYGGTEYEFRLAARNDTATSAFTTPVVATTKQGPPVPPQNLRVTSTTTTSVTLNWNSQNGLTGYRLEYSSDGGSTWKTVTPAPLTTSKTATVNGLNPNTKYTFRLTAINSSYADPAQREASREIDGATGPETPQNFRSISRTTNSVTLSWDKQTGVGITGYTLEYRLIDGTWSSPRSISASTDTATVTGLNPSTEYEFRLTAKGSNGGSAQALTKDSTVGVAPNPPGNFRVTSVNEDSVSLSWNPQSGVTYKLQYRRTADTNWTDYPEAGAVLPSSQSSITVSGLDPNTVYEFQITAINPDGEATMRLNDVRTGVTVPAQPSYFEASTSTTSSITLVWNKQNDLTGYVLEYRASSSSRWTVYPGSLAAGSTGVTINGLQSATKYDFRLTAQNSQGDSQPALLEGVWTKYAAADIVPGTPYQPPQKVYAELTDGKQSTSVTVRWDPSPNAAANTVYVVQYSVDGIKWKSVTVKGGQLEKELKLASGKTYHFKVYAKGEKNGLSQGQAKTFDGTVRTWAVLKAASLTALKATAFPGLKSQEQIAVKVKNFANNAISSVPVDTLKVWYTDKVSGVTKTAELKFNGSAWLPDGNVTFESGVIVVSGLEPSHKYKVEVQFSNVTPTREATSKKPTAATFSTTKANWSTPVSNIQPAVSGSSVSVTYISATDDKGTPASSYTVKAYTWTGTKYKVAKKVTAAGTNALFANLKPGTYFITVTANKDSLHEAGVEAVVNNQTTPSVTVV